MSLPESLKKSSKNVFSGTLELKAPPRISLGFFNTCYEEWPELRVGGKVVVMPFADFARINEQLHNKPYFPVNDLIVISVPPKKLPPSEKSLPIFGEKFKALIQHLLRLR